LTAVISDAGVGLQPEMDKTENTKARKKSGLHFISAFVPSIRPPFRGVPVFIPTDNAGVPAFGLARLSIGCLQQSLSSGWERGQTAFVYLFSLGVRRRGRLSMSIFSALGK
jgi:hypothetical protein